MSRSWIRIQELILNYGSGSDQNFRSLADRALQHVEEGVYGIGYFERKEYLEYCEKVCDNTMKLN